jgi:3-hydroxymyristoyl/3-hydroxydecanoyl-(acyl carrier protein) dehydratase
MVILNFDVDCRIEEESVFTMNTTFGFFPKDALENQQGLPASDDDRARLEAASEHRFEVAERPAYFDGSLRLGTGKLLMLDRVTGYWPGGGSRGLGRLRAEKDVHPGQWFFKAHFFQDPVQPGSLGVEAMLQAMQCFMIEEGLGDRFEAPRFEPIASGAAVQWKYRGQVRPNNEKVVVEVDVAAIEEAPQSTMVAADVLLWVDGMPIYEAKGLAIRIIESSRESHG